MKHNIPTRQHPDCDMTGCPVCLTNHVELADYLARHIRDHKADLLKEYRKWLDRQGIPAETNGWASREAFDLDNIEAFIEQQRKALGEITEHKSRERMEGIK